MCVQASWERRAAELRRALDEQSEVWLCLVCVVMCVRVCIFDTV